MSFNVQPWLLDRPPAQILITTLNVASETNFRNVLNKQLSLEISIGNENDIGRIATTLHLKQKMWTTVKLLYPCPSGAAENKVHMLSSRATSY